MAHAPDIPNLPNASPQLVDFLTRFRLWAMNELSNKVPQDQAISALHFLPSDQKPPATTLMLTIDHTGAIHVMQMPLGGGLP